jgi:hypothetical protein
MVNQTGEAIAQPSSVSALAPSAGGLVEMDFSKEKFRSEYENNSNARTTFRWIAAKLVLAAVIGVVLLVQWLLTD